MAELTSPRLVVAVCERSKQKALEEIFLEKQLRFNYLLSAHGTDGSEVLKAVGLTGTEKTVGLSIVDQAKAGRIMTAVAERLGMGRAGSREIVFSIPISGASQVIAAVAGTKEQEDVMEQREARSGSGCELVVAIVDGGYSQQVTEAAKGTSVLGGTILHGREANLEEASRFFGISLQPDKDVVWFVVGHSGKAELMQAIAKSCGLLTDAHGLVISLPIDACMGATLDSV